MSVPQGRSWVCSLFSQQGPPLLCFFSSFSILYSPSEYLLNNAPPIHLTLIYLFKHISDTCYNSRLSRCPLLSRFHTYLYLSPPYSLSSVFLSVSLIPSSFLLTFPFPPSFQPLCLCLSFLSLIFPFCLVSFSSLAFHFQDSLSSLSLSFSFFFIYTQGIHSISRKVHIKLSPPSSLPTCVVSNKLHSSSEGRS